MISVGTLMIPHKTLMTMTMPFSLHTVCVTSARLLGQEPVLDKEHGTHLLTDETLMTLIPPLPLQALCATPARLLGQELVLDKKEQGKHGLSDEIDVAYCVGDAKVSGAL